MNRSMPPSVITPVLGYADVLGAAAWLCRAFGFTGRLRIADHRVQLLFDGASVVVTQRGAREPSSAPGAADHSIMVRVNDVDAHYQRAKENGARIVSPPTDFPYGERQYTAEDPGGHAWTFSQTIRDVDPSEWGGMLIEPRAS
jgi:uncharacterized glyoxalase superfamily protein PhnB